MEPYFPTVENAYQASKFFEPGDSLRFGIVDPFYKCSPGEAKHMSRKLGAFLRKDWDAIKLKVMADLVRQKFEDPALATLLLETGEEELVEGNNWGDVFWGRCWGRGENNLGRILMDERKYRVDKADCSP